MICSFISDIHVESQNEAKASLLLSFLNNPKVQESNRIYFLGDIFDALIGEHREYVEDFSFFFDEIIKLLNSGKEVYFIEGNHDFHFENIAKEKISESLNKHNFHYLTEGHTLQLNNNKYFVCHGYEVDYYNISFKRWYKVYSSRLFRFIVSYIFSYKFIRESGSRASQNSKKRGGKYFNFREMKAKYLKGAKQLILDKDVKGVIAGHTHIKAFHQFENETFYINNGFPLKDKVFTYFDGNEFELCNIISESDS